MHMHYSPTVKVAKEIGDEEAEDETVKSKPIVMVGVQVKLFR